MYSQYPLTPYGTLPCIFSFKRGGILPLGWGLDDALFVGCVCMCVCVCVCVCVCACLAGWLRYRSDMLRVFS